MILTKNFKIEEFASKDGSEFPNTVFANITELANNLQVLRDEINKPIRINSGYRSIYHNQAVGGSKSSQHILGRAADITSKGLKPIDLYNTIEKLIESGKILEGGLGLYDTFVHYDTRGHKARWNYSKK